MNVKADRAKARINFNVKVAGVGNQLDMAGKREGVKDVPSHGLEILPGFELSLKLNLL